MARVKRPVPRRIWEIDQSIKRYLTGKKNRIKGISVDSSMKCFTVNLWINLPEIPRPQLYMGRSKSKIEAVAMLRAAEQCLALAYPDECGHLAGNTPAAVALRKHLVQAAKRQRQKVHLGKREYRRKVFL